MISLGFRCGVTPVMKSQTKLHLDDVISYLSLFSLFVHTCHGKSIPGIRRKFPRLNLLPAWWDVETFHGPSPVRWTWFGGWRWHQWIKQISIIGRKKRSKPSPSSPETMGFLALKESKYWGVHGEVPFSQFNNSTPPNKTSWCGPAFKWSSRMPIWCKIRPR